MAWLPKSINLAFTKYLIKMSEEIYKTRNQPLIQFFSFAVEGCVDEIPRKEEQDLTLNCVRQTLLNDGALLYCWCIMNNHLHVIILLPDGIRPD